MSGLIIRARQQGNLLKVKVDQKLSNIANHSHGGGTRSAITGFSRSSRKRLLEKFAGLDESIIKQKGCAFLTLSYGQSWPDPATAKKHLESYVRRIARRAEILDPSFVWKMEPQDRGAPHFHIAIFGWKKIKGGWPITKYDFARIWGEVIGSEYMNHNDPRSQGIPTPPFTRIELVRSFRRLMYYVSKYMAKEFEQKESLDPLPGQGFASGQDSSNRLDPRSDQVPALAGSGSCEAAAGSCETGFINLAYLATNGASVEFIGRSWGIMYRDNLPNGESQEMLIECNGNFDDFHRLVRWKWARISEDQRGFTVFHEKASDWFEILERYVGYCEGVPF